MALQDSATASRLPASFTFYATGLLVEFNQEAYWKQRTYPYEHEFAEDDDDLEGAIVLDPMNWTQSDYMTDCYSRFRWSIPFYHVRTTHVTRLSYAQEWNLALMT